MLNWERTNIAVLTGYKSGEQSVNPKIIKLNTNENPYPPSPIISNALKEFSLHTLRKYPSPTADAFRGKVAELHNIRPQNIIATRGGDELLRLMITTFVNPGEVIGTTLPTYSLYPVLAAIQDCPLKAIPLSNDWELPSNFATQLNNAGTKLTFLVNPHAPSGVLFNRDKIAQLAQDLDGILLLDEAYVDFVDPRLQYDSVPLINELDNVVILRTLSKGYSLAGLRLGYGIGAPELIDPMLNKTKDSYNIDALSQYIGCKAIEDNVYFDGNCQLVRRERSKLVLEFKKLGFQVVPSETNFILVTVPSNHKAEAVYLDLKQRNILVRFFDQQGLSDKLRVTVGTPEENQELVNVLTNLL
ncbi:MAG: histidinol-phosphate transaminase [Candidatus Azotimanducaceae bacterium]